jgi:hypothetical protein
MKKVLSLLGINRLISPVTYINFYRGEKETPVKKWFRQSLGFFRAKTVKSSEDAIVLVQMVKDYAFTIKLAAASKVLAEKNNWLVSFYDVTINWSKKMSRIESFFNRIGINNIKNIHSSFGDTVGFSNSEKYRDQAFIQRKKEEIEKALAITGVDGLLELEFENVKVGDLIYDSYLRFFSKPTVEKIDEDILLTIEIGMNIFYNFKEYLNHNKVKALLTTYSSYIYHGIVVRICLEEDIAVYNLGYHNYVIQQLHKEFPYHGIDHSLFSPEAPITDAQLEMAEERFTSRFKGTIDSATSYMRASAYTDRPVDEAVKKLFKEKKRNIILYAHDFYDSPHINRQIQFNDFYQYLKAALAALADVDDTSVFIKIHPNGMPGSKEKAIELVENFRREHFHILDESVSNHQIIELKPDLVCTARGTIGIEMGYFGIPTVALYDNIYVNFNFVHTCYNKESYYAILRGEQMPQINFDKKLIYSFYYQAYLDKIIRDENNIFREVQAFKGDTYSDEFLVFLSNTSFIESRQKMLGYYEEALLNN